MHTAISMETLQENFENISTSSVYLIRRPSVGKSWPHLVHTDDLLHGLIARISIRRNGLKVWRLVIISNSYNFKNKYLIHNKKITVFKIRGVFIYMHQNNNTHLHDMILVDSFIEIIM